MLPAVPLRETATSPVHSSGARPRACRVAIEADCATRSSEIQDATDGNWLLLSRDADGEEDPTDRIEYRCGNRLEMDLLHGVHVVEQQEELVGALSASA